jgi:hypothetical protein
MGCERTAFSTCRRSWWEFFWCDWSSNAAFLKGGGAPEQFRAGIQMAVDKGWMVRHESGTYVKFTPAGAELFA